MVLSKRKPSLSFTAACRKLLRTSLAEFLCLRAAQGGITMGLLHHKIKSERLSPINEKMSQLCRVMWIHQILVVSWQEGLKCNRRMFDSFRSETLTKVITFSLQLCYICITEWMRQKDTLNNRCHCFSSQKGRFTRRYNLHGLPHISI